MNDKDFKNNPDFNEMPEITDFSGAIPPTRRSSTCIWTIVRRLVEKFRLVGSRIRLDLADFQFL